MTSKRRLRCFAGAGLLLVFLVLLGWLLLPRVVGPVVERLAVRAGLKEPQLHVSRLDKHSVVFSRVEFALSSRLGPVFVELEDADIAYSIFPLALRELRIAKATLHLDYQAGARDGARVASSSGFPLNRLIVRQFEFIAKGPWGLSQIAGQAEIHRTDEGSLHLSLETPHQVLDASLWPSADRALARLVLPSGSILLELNAVQGEKGWHINLHADEAGKLLENLASSPVMPEYPRKTIIARARFDALAGVALDVSADATPPHLSSPIIAKLTRGDRTLAETRLTIPQTGPVQVDGRIDLPATLAYDLAAPWTSDQDWRPIAGELKGSVRIQGFPGNSWSGDGVLEGTGLGMANRMLRLADAEVHLQTSALNAQEVAFNALLSNPGGFFLWGDVRAPREGPITVDARSSASATSLLDMLAPLLPERYRRWQAEKGYVRGAALLAWQTGGWEGKVQARLEDLTLKLGDARLENAWAALSYSDLARRSGQFNAGASALRLTPDVVATDLSVAAQVGPAELDLTKARLSLFGGQVALSPTVARLDGGEVRSSLRVHNIDLACFLQSFRQQGLSGSGTLEGELPVILGFKPPSLEIRDGRIDAVEGGRLKFQHPGLDRENIAFKALAGFLYHTLKASMNYSPNGAYGLGLRLEGHNPEVLNGHPLALNLNIKGRLPALLQDGILSGDFDRPVLEWVQANGIGTSRDATPAKPLRNQEFSNQDRRRRQGPHR